MKQYILLACGLLAMPMAAQNMVDAVRISSKDVAGTARYRAMGGAFGALGGDLSSMNDNPAGMGIFRGTSEFSLTPSLTINRTKTEGSMTGKEHKADGSFSNLGFVASFRTPNASSLVNFNIGMSINHSEGINRRYASTLNTVHNSFAEYLANRANNSLLAVGRYGNPGYMGTDDGIDDNRFPISALLGYKTFAIDDNVVSKPNENDPSTWIYEGVNANFNNAVGLQQLFVREETRMDEYNINMSANWGDFLYAGLTLNIADFNSIIQSEYAEDYGDGVYHNYFNDLETKGTGVGIKAGLLVKPTDAWRIGVAVHTPTWLHLTDYYNADMYTDLGYDESIDRYRYLNDTYDYKYRLNTPWEYQISSAFVFGQHGLVSVEYDMTDYSSLKYRRNKDSFGWGAGDEFSDINDAMQNDYLALQHTFKVGAEYRLTKVMSLRAGYVYKSSPYQDCVFDNVSRGWNNGNFGDDNTLLFDSGTKPNYALLDNQQIISGGIGWRWTNWYIDLSFQNRIAREKIAAFPTTDAISFVDYDNHTVEMSDDPSYGAVKGNLINMRYNNLHFDLTVGMRF